MQEISSAREGIKEMWATGGFSPPLEEAEAKGAAKSLIDVLDMIDEVGGLNERSSTTEENSNDM